MGSTSSELVVPFLGALQAAVSVLLTIFLGVLSAQFHLLSVKSAKEVSRLCVRMLMPALLIYKIGSNLHADTAVRYVPVLIWSTFYTLLSMALGSVATRSLKLPAWVTPALTFNNTTSLPLLLIQSLGTTGVLKAILQPGESASDALDRAESYFLVNAMVTKTLTFAFGPKLLAPCDEDAPDDADAKDDNEQGPDGEMSRGPDGIIDEETSLLPQRIISPTNRGAARGYKRGLRWYQSLPTWARGTLDFLHQFANPPFLGALVGAIIGLTPPLHRLFFNDSNNGGYFNAWLTSAIKNTGNLFACLQIIVVGVKLSQSLQKMKRGEESGVVPKTSLALITIVRFIVWPLISIPFIWALATRTNMLDDDPILWFALMLMPTGPPATILVALTDVNGSPEEEKMAVAKLLTISYAITPLICFAVVGSLRASQAAIGV